MGHKVEYIKCKVCGSDTTKLEGVRGNLEYEGALPLNAGEEHIVTNVCRCVKCGFVYTNPFIILDNEKRSLFYDDPGKYLSSVSSADPTKVFQRSLDIIAKFAKNKGKLLDIGSGKGEFMALARKTGWNIYGIEPSGKFRDYAALTYGLKDQSASLQEAALPLGSFDVVALNMVLEHVDDPHRLICQVKGLLKKGGIVFTEVPNTDSLLLGLIKIYYRIKGKNWSPLLSPLHYPYHSYGYNASSLKALYETNGLVLRKIIVTGIGLRGFRSKGKLSILKNIVMNFLSGISALIGRGDILIVIGENK